MVLEKGPPGLGGRLRVPDHVFGDGCLRDFDSNLQQFSVNAWSTPTWVGEAHLPNQIPDFRGYRRTAFPMPTLPSPIESKAFAMPGDDGLGLEDEQCRSPIVPQAGEPDPEDAIRPAETKLVATARTLYDQKLMAYTHRAN
jgi:hypothetical protein